MTTEATNASLAKMPVPSAEAVGNLTLSEQRDKRDVIVPSGQLWVQPKLTMGAPDDPYEKEADAVADKVMRMPEHHFVQRKCAECEEEASLQTSSYDTSYLKPTGRPSNSFLQQKSEAGETEKVHEKSRGYRTESFIDDDTAKLIQTSRGSGTLLQQDTADFMGARIGGDFSKVRIHTDTDSAEMTRRINAHAFTVGKDIYFNTGKFDTTSPEGKRLLAHELTHVVQQDSGKENRIQREVGYAPADDGEFEPLRSNATTISGMARDGIFISTLTSGITHVMVFSQFGLTVYNLSARRVAHYDDREEEPTINPSMWRLERGSLKQYGRRNGENIRERRTFDPSTFSEERQMIINERGFIAFPEDFARATHLDLQNYLPAIVVFGQVSVSVEGDGNEPSLQEWASDQVRNLGEVMGVEVNSGGPSATDSAERSSLTRDTAADAQRPDRLVSWVRQDGEQFVNVWVGGRNRAEGGEVVAVQLREGESLEELQGRVQQATERARHQLSERAVREEEALTGGNAAINDSTYLGGSESNRTANRSAYRASMSGPEVMVRGGTGAYSMTLHYEDVYPDLLGQVSAAFNGSDYVWQVINITPLYQRLMLERAAAIQHMQEQIMRDETLTAPAIAESETDLQGVRQSSDLDSEQVGMFGIWRGDTETLLKMQLRPFTTSLIPLEARTGRRKAQ